MKIERSERKYHVIAWAIWIAIMSLIIRLTGTTYLMMGVSAILYYAFHLFLFYSLALFVLPTFWKKDAFLLTGSFVLLAVFYIGYRYVVLYYLIPFLDEAYLPPRYTNKQFFSAQLWWFFQMSFFAVGYFTFKRSVSSIKQKNELEKSLIQSETSFLKTQFNPHFIFNVLSYMYSKAASTSEELSNAIELLSEIMRYSMKETSPSEKVSLTDELNHIENFIELNKMRFNNDMYVEFTVEGDLITKRIIPLILISQVENAFKHGLLNDPQHPLIICLRAKPKEIEFLIRNKKKPRGIKGSKPISHGIGLENVRKRLELAYGKNFEQEIEETPTDYSYKLTIKD